MKDYNIKQLPTESLLLVISSTFGNGDPPENGEVFTRLIFDSCVLNFIVEINYVCADFIGDSIGPRPLFEVIFVIESPIKSKQK